jgi:hypothetical protein
MASVTPSGMYFAGAGAIDLGEVYCQWSALLPARKHPSKEPLRHEPEFQLFVAIAIGALLFETFLSERRSRP